VYAFQENFVLPLSHDEVVHGKGSLIDKMPGDDWQKFANLRLLYTYMFATPGKKLLFMGCEFAQWSEWKHDQALDMHLEQYHQHRGIRELVSHLARSYRAVPALHQLDSSHEGFEWIDANDSDNSVLSFVRKDRDGNVVVCAFNFTPVPRHNHRLGVPREGFWGELVNTDAAEYGGSGHGNMGGVEATPVPAHGRPWSVNITLPPLGALLLQLE
jgi:1,4-alpha-glucan branching enzyme